MAMGMTGSFHSTEYIQRRRGYAVGWQVLCDFMRKCFIAPRRSRCGYSYANRRVWYCSRERSYVVGYGAQSRKLEQGYGWSSGLGDGPLCQRRGRGGDEGRWDKMSQPVSYFAPLGEPEHKLRRNQDTFRC